MDRPDWQWDEMQQVGVDYTDIAEVEAYDGRMAKLRDVDAENAEMFEMLNLPSGAKILEIGCGTGRFARAAAKAGYEVTAVDVSQVMLEYVESKIEQEGGVIKTEHAGFLTMDFEEGSFDAVVSGLALHHLPDVWKYAALLNIASVLKPKGGFILRDVVFACKENERPEVCMDNFVEVVPGDMRRASAKHAATEFSTYDWIMEGLLERAGLQIISATNPSGFLAVYHCKRL